MPSFYVQNFGCRATQADGAAIERELLETGLQRALEPGAASVVVLNTCTVTAAADADARAAIRRIRRQNPGARILVTGCYAQRAPEELAALPGVDRVVGNSHKAQVAKIAASSCAGAPGFVPLAGLSPSANGHGPMPGGILVGDIFAHTELLAAPVFDADLASEKTRPNLKVQDGCDNRCSFCVIPSVRGQSRSLPLGQVLAEVNALVAQGYRELVLSGINLGRWGRDLAPATGAQRHGENQIRLGRAGQRSSPRFEDLIRAILDGTALERLRISSVEPMDWSEELIELVASSPRIARHAHLPLQSGSDKVLRRMHRKYRPWHYADKLRRIRAAMPGAAIGADVMVGFPGETDAEFDETRQFIAELGFTYLHVFTFSGRPGTPAASMPNQVPVAVARERNRILRELIAEKNRVFRASFVGKTIEAITLSRGGADERGPYTEALTDNYLKLHIAGAHEPNRWIEVEVTHLTADGVSGCRRVPGHQVTA